MNVIAIVVALGVEQWRTFRWRGALQDAFVRYARWLERRFNGGSAQHGALATALALAPPVLVAACGYWTLAQLHPLLGLAWNVLILYLLVGFRHFSHAFSAIVEALKAGDAITARRRLVAWRGTDATSASADEIPKLAIEQGLADSYCHVFGTLFWFLILPGPAGAVLYRATVLLAAEWRAEESAPLVHRLDAFGAPVRRLLQWLDWIPLRLTAATFAVVGDFEDAVYCWRTQAGQWPRLHDGILLASGAGALGVIIGGPITTPTGEPEFRPELGIGEAADAEVLPSAAGLVWRALLVWLAVLLILTLAYWAP